MGYDSRPATDVELEGMTSLVARSMEEGAWGLVTRFESGGPAHPEEILAMAKVASSYGGNYTSHHGSEGFEQEKEIAFAIRVAEEARIPVHLFHLKVRARDNWGTMERFLAQIEAARARGLDITANQYPYTAMFHGWRSFFPLWMREGGPERFGERLRDESLREEDQERPELHHVGERTRLVGRDRHGPRQHEREREVPKGRASRRIAALRGDSDPADTCIQLMAEEGGIISGVFHAMSDEDVRLVMQKPWVAVASDGSAINLEARGLPHPRNYGTNPRVLGHYVRDEHVAEPRRRHPQDELAPRPDTGSSRPRPAPRRLRRGRRGLRPRGRCGRRTPSPSPSPTPRESLTCWSMASSSSTVAITRGRGRAK